MWGVTSSMQKTSSALSNADLGALNWSDMIEECNPVAKPHELPLHRLGRRPALGNLVFTVAADLAETTLRKAPHGALIQSSSSDSSACYGMLTWRV